MGKQIMLLKHISDLILVLFDCLSRQPCSIYSYLSFFRFFYPCKKTEKGGFSASGFPYNPKGMDIFKLQCQVIQDLSVIILEYMV